MAAKKLRVIASRPGRLKGLLGKRPDDEVAVLVPCRDIHTYGMRYDLDIAFVNAQGIVLETYRKVPPRSRLKNKSAIAVVEGFTLCHDAWFSQGDRIVFAHQEEGKGK